MAQIATIERGVHLLFRGANGNPCYGIEVRALGSEDAVEKRGYRRTWGVNQHVILNTDSWQDTLGLTDAEVMAIRHEVVVAILNDKGR